MNYYRDPSAIRCGVSTMAVSHSDQRLAALKIWLAASPKHLGVDPDTLRPASDDASFRRYFRVDCSGAPEGTLIVMDAPPEREDSRPFVQAAAVLEQAGLCVPSRLRVDLESGFLLLGDLGGETYLSALNAQTAGGLYDDAATALIRLQRASAPGVFPQYDRAVLERELRLYPDWYITRHKGFVLSEAQNGLLAQGFNHLIENALAQPQVFVHRDWHSRNLMRLDPARNPGVLDFQDALFGPITYDLVSLLRDAYIDWPEAQQIDWAVRYWERAKAAALPVQADFGDFYRDFEWMGLQRQLKVLGIFARLNHRDGKSRYLADMPRVWRYAIGVARRYQALAGLARVIEDVEQTPSRSGYTF